MTDAQHVAAVQQAAEQLNATIAAARADGLTVQVIPELHTGGVAVAVSRALASVSVAHYEGINGSGVMVVE